MVVLVMQGRNLPQQMCKYNVGCAAVELWILEKRKQSLEHRHIALRRQVQGGWDQPVSGSEPAYNWVSPALPLGIREEHNTGLPA